MKRSISPAAIVFASLLPALGLLIAQDQPAAPAQKKQMKGKQMMKGQAKDESSMMAQHAEMAKLVNQVAADLAALQKETDVATIKAKLAVDQAALEKVRAHMNQQESQMKSMMEGMMGAKATGDKPKAEDKTEAPADHSANH